VTTNDKAQLERILKRVLAGYAQAEPRSGLEMRVIANVRAERKRLALRRRRWWWATVVASAAAMLLATAWLLNIPETPTPTLSTNRPSPAIAKTAPGTAELSPREVPHAPIPRHLIRRVHHHRRRQKTRRLQAAYKERPGQFPSPKPLTDQEKILQHYVEQYKEDAILTARAQAELVKREEKENAVNSQSSGNDRP